MTSSKFLQEQLALINHKISTSNGVEHGCGYYELLERLHLLLVKNNTRRVYYNGVSLKKFEYFENRPDSDINSIIIENLGNDGGIKLNSLNCLKQASSKINLKIHEEKHCNFYINSNDVIPNNICNAFCRSRDYGRHVWIFNDPNVKTTLKNVVERNTRIGDLLEYPKCCVDWFTEIQTNSLIDCYYCYRNMPVIRFSDEGAVNFLLDYFETDYIPNNKKRILYIQKNHVKKTILNYPFVYHQACASCLKNSTSPSARLNHKYGEFARLISQEFYNNLIDESKKIVTMYQ